MVRTGFAYLAVTVLCAAAGAVYELFSFEVYSYYMIYAFAFPLVGGVVPFFALGFCSRSHPRREACSAYHAGIAALTVGSLLQGALEIYGTTNRLVSAYWWLGSLLVLAGLAHYVLLDRIIKGA